MVKRKNDGLLRAFSQAFHEVVAPILEEIKGDIKEISEDTDRIERKLVKIDDRLDRFGGKVDNHERRITRLETKTGITV